MIAIRDAEVSKAEYALAMAEAFDPILLAVSKGPGTSKSHSPPVHVLDAAVLLCGLRQTGGPMTLDLC